VGGKGDVGGKGAVGGKGDAGGKGDVEGKGVLKGTRGNVKREVDKGRGDVEGWTDWWVVVTLWCQAFVAIDGAGSSSVVVPCWRHLVSVCHCRLLVIVCHDSISPVSWSRCCPASSLHLAVRLSSCCVIVMSSLSSHVCTMSLAPCVSAKWVGTNMGQGVLTMVSKINSNNERQHWSSFVVWLPRCGPQCGTWIS